MDFVWGFRGVEGMVALGDVAEGGGDAGAGFDPPIRTAKSDT